MKKIFIILSVVLAFSLNASALEVSKTSNVKDLKKKREITKPKAQIIAILPEIKGGKPLAKRSLGEIQWTREFKNMKADPIPANVLGYEVFQSMGEKNPVLMTRGTIKEAIPGNQVYKLTGEFFPCCGYNKFRVDIINNTSGGTLISGSAGSIPTLVTRSAVTVESVFVHSKQVSKDKVLRTLKARIKNKAEASIRVKLVGYWKKKETQNWVKIMEKSIVVLSSEGVDPSRSYYKIHDDRVMVFDTMRIELSEDFPIQCPKKNCHTYKIWEGPVTF